MLAIMGIVVEPSLIPVHLLLIPVLLVHDRILVIGKRSSFRAVIVLAAARLLPCGAFVLT
ncbi:hypothetical protein [Microlunatus sp. GCM10028923]|uniref:hypothetical protein n=1 Tax=Microlunatus sp. GCM10028923 TaxID=3273400 RepID=UPI00360A9FA1